MEHHTTTMAVVKRKRNRMKAGPPPQWSVVQEMLHMTIKDAAAVLKVPESCLRSLCKKNGNPIWPGKTMRYMKSTGRKLILEASAPEGSPLAGLAAGPSQKAKVTEIKKDEKKELVTLNLLDKVGSSSASSKRN